MSLSHYRNRPGSAQGNARGASTLRQEEASTQSRGPSMAGRVMLAFLMLAIVSGIALVSVRLLSYMNEQRIEVLRVEGALVHVREDDIANALAGFMNMSLLKIDLVRVRAAIESLEWVKRASVRREWPDTLNIHVDEQRAIARWRGGHLLNQDGAIFTTGEDTQLMQLPYLEGPEGSEFEVMQQYQKFSQLLYPYGQKVKEVYLNGRGGWAITLEGNVEVNVGEENVMGRMRRLVSFLELNELEVRSIRSIDLRYSNGLAIESRQSIPEEMVSL